MERLKTKTFIFRKEYFMQLGLLLSMAFAFTACGDDGGDGVVPAIVAPGVVGSCANCAEVNAAPKSLGVFSASNVRNTVQLRNMQIYGNGNRHMSQATPWNTPYASYYGPVAVTGEFVANGPLIDQSGMCQITQGVYRVDVLQAGTLGSPAGGNLQLPDMLVQPGNIRISISQGIMYSGGTKLMGILRIISVNGLPCDPRFIDNLY